MKIAEMSTFFWARLAIVGQLRLISDFHMNFQTLGLGFQTLEILHIFSKAEQITSINSNPLYEFQPTFTGQSPRLQNFFMLNSAEHETFSAKNIWKCQQ